METKLTLRAGWTIQLRAGVWTLVNPLGGAYYHFLTPSSPQIARYFPDSFAVIAEMVAETQRGSPLFTHALEGGEVYEAAYRAWIDRQSTNVGPGLDNASACACGEAI